VQVEYLFFVVHKLSIFFCFSFNTTQPFLLCILFCSGSVAFFTYISFHFYFILFYFISFVLGPKGIWLFNLGRLLLCSLPLFLQCSPLSRSRLGKRQVFHFNVVLIARLLLKMPTFCLPLVFLCECAAEQGESLIVQRRNRRSFVLHFCISFCR